MVADMALTAYDVANLAKEPSPETRAAVAAKVALRFDNALITQRERDLAHEILTVLLKDAEELVRESLAKSISHLPGAPKDIIVALTEDRDMVAVPVLEFSPVLEDEELLEIVRKGSAAKQTAIAARSEVSADLSDALIATDNRNVIARLVANKGAIIRDNAFAKVVRQYGSDDRVAAPLVKREDLPVSIVEQLVTAVSEQYRTYLVEHHKIKEDLAFQLIRDSRERATVGLADGVAREDLPRLIQQLAVNGRLTPSLILRAVCTGEMAFAECAFAHLTGLSESRVAKLVLDKGPLGLKAAFARARLPQVLFPAFRAAIDIYQEMDYTAQPHDREHFKLVMLERLLTSYENLEGDDLDFLLSKMAQLSDQVSEGQEQAVAS
ncbi:MAG: DUF2336 domain-containing protein [Parvibaculaceae bacterium]